MNADGKCKTCITSRDIYQGERLCTRHAPICVPCENDKRFGTKTRWPVVHETMGCGDYEFNKELIMKEV